MGSPLPLNERVSAKPSGEMPTMRAVVSGRVQGVGFRYFVEDAAVRLGLEGAVWNRRDGGVEVLARGERSALELLLERLRRGPSLSRVDAVEVQWDVDVPEGRGFRITHG
jgi:acylphosphatase